MKLHEDKTLFEQLIRAASESLGIIPEFIEKDYWITHILKQLANSKHVDRTVFKGGTSLSKGYKLINRFSEDIDLAILDSVNITGNQLKTLIRDIENLITKDLIEKQEPQITSKGSRFRKSVYEYESYDPKNKNNRIIVEINSFANPYPFENLEIKSFVYDFLSGEDNHKFIEEHELKPFCINILNKKQTLIEKLVSLIRFSYDENHIQMLSSKIRHFYDLYYLLEDQDCKKFIKSTEFKISLGKVLEHDKGTFDEPNGWKNKSIQESPLITDFDNVWEKLKGIYNNELSSLAFSEIPDEKNVQEKLQYLIQTLIK